MPSYQQLREVRFKSYSTTERDAEWENPPSDLVIFNTTTQRLEIFLADTWQAFVEDPDAGDITYTPGVLTDWDSDADPGDLDDALDQLAERVDDNEILSAAHGPSQHTEGTAWRLVYQDASGDEQEIVLGADGTFLESNGASAAPAFRAVVAADLSDFDATAVSAVGTDDAYLKNDANDETSGDLTVANLITAGNVDGIDVSAHDVATTGVHGAGGDTLATDADIAAQDIADHNDTTATGAELETLTDGSDADSLHTHGKLIFERSITIEDPTSSEDITIAFINRAITVTEMRAVLIGTANGQTVTWTIRHHASDRSNAGNEVVTGGTTTTSLTTGSDVTAFNDATIPADSFIWLETTAKGGTVTELHVTIIGTID